MRTVGQLFDGHDTGAAVLPHAFAAAPPHPRLDSPLNTLLRKPLLAKPRRPPAPATPQSSLPELPHLAEAIQGSRPPTFLLLASEESRAELLERLEVSV